VSGYCTVLDPDGPHGPFEGGACQRCPREPVGTDIIREALERAWTGPTEALASADLERRTSALAALARLEADLPSVTRDWGEETRAKVDAEWRAEAAEARVLQFEESLREIVIRCEEGDQQTNWLPTIANIARAALAGSVAVA